MMGRSGLGLFSGLALIGAISGFILGELFIGRGNGLYVAPVSSLVGLLLAWALWKTRPAAIDAPDVPHDAPAPPTRQPPQATNTVRVTKTGRTQHGGKKR